MDLSKEFSLADSIIYLNHAAVAPWPVRTAQAICAFASENQQYGASHYLEWLKIEHELRQLLATLINAPSPDDIALVKNTSEGLSMIAYGLDWKQGDNIVIPDCEFPSNRIVWESLKDRGVEVRQVDILSSVPAEQAIINSCDSKTRLVSISSVQYASGFRLDLPVIGEFCHKQGILFCVDAIQSIGALQFDAQSCYADFVVADGHKWMLGPEGIALFYTSAASRNMLSVSEYGWHMLAEPGNFDQREWSISPTARRFECGSPNMLGIFALHASISLLLETGMPQIEQRLLDKTRIMSDFIRHHPQMEILSSLDADRQSGITSFRIRNRPAQRIYQELMTKNIICALRDNAVRFSPHFYTPDEQLYQALETALNL